LELPEPPIAITCTDEVPTGIATAFEPDVKVHVTAGPDWLHWAGNPLAGLAARTPAANETAEVATRSRVRTIVMIRSLLARRGALCDLSKAVRSVGSGNVHAMVNILMTSSSRRP
jgi:hypothetical protein